ACGWRTRLIGFDNGTPSIVATPVGWIRSCARLLRLPSAFGYWAKRVSILCSWKPPTATKPRVSNDYFRNQKCCTTMTSSVIRFMSLTMHTAQRPHDDEAQLSTQLGYHRGMDEKSFEPPVKSSPRGVHVLAVFAAQVVFTILVIRTLMSSGLELP